MVNELIEAEQPVLQPALIQPPDYWSMDASHDLFSTNLHTHGLHISPGGKHDNVFLQLPPTTEGGKPTELFLNYTLNQKHAAGTFWYHAHHHGNVAYQLANGMAGALIVPGDPQNPQDLESIPAVAKANEIADVPGKLGRIMVFQQFFLAKTARTTSDGANVWVVDPGDVNDRRTVDSKLNDKTIVSGLTDADHRDVTTTNGIQAPLIGLKAGVVERWRFIHAGKETKIEGQWLKQQGQDWVPAPDDSLEMHEIALDGIPTGDLIRYSNQNTADTHLTLYPGYRADVLMRANNVKVGEVYALAAPEQTRLSKQGDGKPGPQSKVPATTLAIVRITAESQPAAFPNPQDFAKWKPIPPVSRSPTRHVKFQFDDADTNAKPPFLGKFGVGDATTNEPQAKPYAETVGLEQIPLKIGTPEIWSVSVSDGEHPFHIHVNPFLVQSPVSLSGKVTQRWIWKDTLQVFADAAPALIYFTPANHAGRSVLHCHILDHEDQGMMKEIFIKSDNPNQYPPLSFLKASAFQSTMPEFIKQDGRQKILVLFKGMACGHCVSNLRDLARISVKLTNADIVALSGMPLPKYATLQVGIPDKAHFSICPVIGDAKLLQSLAISSTISHAVIVWDSSGRETHRYMGSVPLPDSYEVIYASQLSQK